MPVIKKLYLNHYALSLHIYPSQKQMKIIESNMLVFQAVYNHYVANGSYAHKIDMDNVSEILPSNYVKLQDIEPSVIDNACARYRKNWQDFIQHPNVAQPPQFFIKSLYQFTAQYSRELEVIPNIYNSSCSLEFNKGIFINLPKIGKVLAKGSINVINNILQMKEVLIGRVFVYKKSNNHVYAKLALSSNEPFGEPLFNSFKQQLPLACNE